MVLFFVLKSLYFEPLLALLKKREGLTLGKKSEAENLRLKFEELSSTYNTRMRQAKEAMEARRVDALQKVKSSAEQKIHEAKTKAEKKLWDYQDSLELEAKNLRLKFSGLAMDLKKEIVGAMVSSRVVRL